MKITIEIEVTSLADLRTKLLGVTGLNGTEVAAELAESEATPTAPVAKEPKAPRAPAAAKKGKKVNRGKLPPAEAPAEPNVIYPTKDEVFDALKDVSENKDLETARVCLSKFSCARISELKETDYAAFIKVCTEVAAS